MTRLRPAAVVLARALVVALLAAACTNGAEPAPGPSPSPSPSPTTSAPQATGLRAGIVLAPPSDASAALLGPAVEDTARRLAELTTLDITEVRVLRPPSEAFRGDELALLADRGYDLVCTVGPQGADDLVRLAPEYPAVEFCLVDGVIANPPPNVVAVGWDDVQGGFLLGAAAGLVTGDPPAVTGVVLGAATPAVPPVRAGFEAGVRHVRPGLPVLVAPATVEGADGQVEDQEAARAAAAELYAGEAPASALLPLGGEPTVDGTVAAAVAADGLVVGWPVDVTGLVDEGRGDRVLGSVVKRVEQALPLAVTTAFDAEGSSVTIGLGEDAFAFVPGASPRYAAVAGQLQAIIGQLLEGAIPLPSGTP